MFVWQFIPIPLNLIGTGIKTGQKTRPAWHTYRVIAISGLLLCPVAEQGALVDFSMFELRYAEIGGATEDHILDLIRNQSTLAPNIFVPETFNIGTTCRHLPH